MTPSAILFDKDGTLIDFDAFWVSVSVKALEEVLAHFHCTHVPLDEILETFGVHGGVTDIDGVLCKGTYRQMGELVHGVLQKYGCTADVDKVVKTVIDFYEKNADSGTVKPTSACLARVLAELKKRGIRLAVVTTDNEYITRKCLKALEVESLFDEIYTDDGHSPTKPDPFCALDFCQKYGILPKNACMVGDTMTDVTFARNAGMPAVILAKTEKSRERMAPVADQVVSELSELLDLVR